MKTLNEKTKNSIWALFKNDIEKWWFKQNNGTYPNEKIECLLTYVIGEDPPTTSYIMHFKVQVLQLYMVNTQYYTLKYASTFQAKEWLKYSYQFYNDKLRFLEYFEDGIKDFISKNKFKESETTSLRGCLEWISEERGKLSNHQTESTEPANILMLKSKKQDRLKLIQYFDLLNEGTPKEKEDNKPKLGIIKFENDLAFIKLLKNIGIFKDLKDSTINTDINEARHLTKTDLKPISNEFIEMAFKHFSIES